jgi:hypothetical protein
MQFLKRFKKEVILGLMTLLNAGIVVPILVSEDNTFLVFLGGATILFNISLIIDYLTGLYNHFKEKK